MIVQRAGRATFWARPGDIFDVFQIDVDLTFFQLEFHPRDFPGGERLPGSHGILGNRDRRLELTKQLAHGLPGGALEIAQVLAHGRVDARVLNLDCDFFAIFEARAMDLAQRGCGESAGFEIREELIGALAEFAADLLRDHRIVHGRHAVARGLEQIDRLDRQQVVPHREHLHQFHERAAQLS